MLKASFKLVGVTPLGFGKAITSVKDAGMAHDDFEEQTWRERVHCDADKKVYIPPMAIKNCLAEVAKYLGETIKGKGKATYTKHFEAGVLCGEPLYITTKNKPLTVDTLECERLYVPSDGKRGGSTRVWKKFPLVTTWQASGSLLVLDQILYEKPEKVFDYLTRAGTFIGIGRFRPRNNGYYGRFSVEDWKTEKMA